ncbi:MAG TPA: hypothetical protein DHW64_13315 [Chitinophagaceae bacterium]|nr:hypothetical protein [Chitinophagaceae bacterium]
MVLVVAAAILLFCVTKYFGKLKASTPISVASRPSLERMLSGQFLCLANDIAFVYSLLSFKLIPWAAFFST